MTLTEVDPRWIRGEVDRIAVAEGCYFDEDAAALVCDFVETWCCQSSGRWAGKPIELLEWQRDFLMRLFGWKRPTGLRRYSRAYLEVAKKNGKSTLVSALVLYLLLADGEGAPAVYLNACDRDQAGIVFGEAARMVKASPELAARLLIIDSKADKRIEHPEGNGRIVANSSVAGSKDGLNPSATIFDELHRQIDRALWAVFEYASAAREQPLLISITTAGESAEGPWFEQREYSEKVNAGEVLDTRHLGVVYRALEADDVDDPATWRKANPSLGATIDPDKFARELAEAKTDPAKWANFLRLRLNIIMRGESKFLAPGQWEACNAPAILLEGQPLWAGLDLASTDDLAALVGIQGDADDGFDLLARFYLPEDNIAELERKHGQPYRAWAERELITLTPGNSIDYGFIRADVVALAATYDLRGVWADPYNATMLLQALAEEDGLPVKQIRQGFLSLNAPTKELLGLVRSVKVRHGGHPILRWMAGNAVAVSDAAECLKLDKKKSKHKIDGMAALVNALAGATEGGDNRTTVYKTRGLLIL